MKKLLLKFLLHLKLPFWLLYGIADFFFILVYYIVGYRRKVVYDNLRKSFPDKSEKEIKAICRKFYRHLADYFVETTRIATMNEKDMRKHITFNNMEIIDAILEEGRSVTAYFSHCGNWEWVTSIGFWSKFQSEDGKKATFAQIYRPLKNKFADDYFLALRSHFHTRSLAKSSAYRELVKMKNDGILSVTGFMSDQHPSKGDDGHITMLLNQPTAMISGTERIARKLNNGVVYLDMSKVKRGKYIVNVRLITKDPRSMKDGEITEIYTRMLEETICRTPHIWLWSHKRWKIKVKLPSENKN